tara:strand:+ start:710 stop:886 length:177 start_codon:yes stop_codon:yes gene_type:complete
MDSQTIGRPNLSLEMKTVEHYREIAEKYRVSEEYSKMIGLYPTLKTSINDCRDEKLIN